MSASLPQSIALAGLLWLLFLAPIAVVLACKRIGVPRIRAAILPALSSIGAITLTTWAGHAVAGSRGVAVGAMLLLFAILILFAHLHAINRSRAGGTGDHPLGPGRPL